MDSDTFWNKSEVVFLFLIYFKWRLCCMTHKDRSVTLKQYVACCLKKKALCGDLVKIGAELAF